MLDKMELNAKAQDLRIALGEDANSPLDIFALVNRIDGLTLVFYPLGENISGMCVKDGEIKLIAINSTMSYGRQRFSLAHELYHLYYDDESGFNVCVKEFDPKSENEKCADQFASYFLAPYNSLRTAIKKIAGDGPLSVQHVVALEQYFGMSRLAMFWRLVSEGYLRSEELDEYRSDVSSSAKKLGYDDKLYRPTPVESQKRTYGHYLKQVDELRQRDLVSQGKIEELLLDAFRDDIVFGSDDAQGDAVD